MYYYTPSNFYRFLKTILYYFYSRIFLKDQNYSTFFLYIINQYYKNQEFQFLDAEGRLFVDLLPLIRRDYKFNNYQLKTEFSDLDLLLKVKKFKNNRI